MREKKIGRALKRAVKQIPGAVMWAKRPGIKLVHRFRSNIVDMTTVGEDPRIIVILASGKAYRSNAKATRWYRINP